MTLSQYITKHHKTHLIFDFDATLILLHIDWLKFAQIIKEDVLSLDRDLWAEHERSQHVTPLLKGLVDKHGAKAHAIILKHTIAFERQYRTAYTKNDALLTEMAQFRNTYRLFIWSSNSRELLEDVLTQLNMSNWFDVIVGYNDVRHRKPSPEGFALIRDPDVPLERYLLIGDSSHDQIAAAAAGIDFYKCDFFEMGR